MICIYCFHTKTQVTNSRPHKKHPQNWRRRRCPQCQALFSTYERPSTEDITVSYADGPHRAFNLGKLLISIAHAAQHDQAQATYDSLFLAQTIELEIIKHVTATPSLNQKSSTKTPSIESAEIAAITHQVLKKFDELTAMQYAMQHRLIVSVRRRGRPSTTATTHGDDAERG